MQGADINSSNLDSYGDGAVGGGASGNLTTNLTAGQYEYAAVSSVAGTTITLATGLKNTYVTSAVNGTATLRTFQVVRVPQYTNLTMAANIVPPFWNGATGGIIALDVQGQLNFGTATINAAGLGFRGGAGIKQGYNSTNLTTQYVTAGPTNLTAATTNLNAQKGEGIAGTPRFVNVLGATVAADAGSEGYPGGTSSRGAPGNAGGGGNDNGNNSGGGGGGNAGPGGRGGNSTLNTTIGGEPGATFASSPSVLIMGGGGGAGTTNDGSGNTALDGFASSGAPGGGIVIVRTGTVSGSGGIVVDGADAPSGVRNDGAGGGGAGGSILLTAATSQAGLANLTLSAKGGAGGTTRPVDGPANSTAHGPGGGGGGGVIFSSGATQTSLVASTTGGAAGTSTPGGVTTGSATSTFGAANGANASAANGSTSTSNSIANSSAGAVCAPIVLTVPAACANAGKDGATFSATPNTYYPGVGTAAANATSLTVGAIRTGPGAGATPIGVGDLLLIIQMQGADINNANSASYGSTSNVTAGQYEYVLVSSVSGTTVNFTTGLKSTYVTSAANTVPIRTFQVVRVPQYSSLTLTANIVPAAWNGSTGGLVALDVAGTINLNGNTINVSGLGFRGGAARLLTTTNVNDASYLTTTASNLNAQKGEGIAGTPQYVNNGGTLLNTNVDGYPGGSAARGAPGNAGGGGNDNTFNSGGGGGANGGRGGRGGNNYQNNQAIGGEPGAAFAASGTTLVLGGGGGAGPNNDGTGDATAGFSSSGSAGGGLVIVRAGSVAGTGSILANAAATGTGVRNDGGGGGGAGGSILVTAVTPGGLSGLTLVANGAAGASNNPAANGGTQHGPGGGGGGGIIFTNGAVASATANGGANGQTTYTSGGTTATIPYGAAAGAAGVVNTGTSLASTGGTSGASCTSITGNIFDDSNYGGGSGRSLSTAASSASGLSIGSAGTTVELYTSTGGLTATTTTAADGSYSFSGLTAGAGYTVRVVSSTVKSARTPGATGLVPVQTFRTTASAGLGAATSDVNRVGGEAPEKQDAAANSGSQTLAALSAGTATPQSITSITAGTTGVDFGYNFDVVVNTNDAGQGSLRQFILNANALGGEGTLTQAGFYTNSVNLATGNTAAGRAGVALPNNFESSIFMIPAARLTNGVAIITPATALPQITGANTVINGSTQTFNIGNTNDVLLGNGGTVGTATTALSQLNGPEVQLVGNRNFTGLQVAANNTTVRGLSLYGFSDNIIGGPASTGTLIEQNVIGASATSFTDPGANARTLGEGIDLNGSDNGTVRNNLIGFNGGMGIWVANSFNDNTNGANNNLISGNEIRGNAQETTAAPERLVFDGLELQGNSTGNTVSGNLITANLGHGIDSFDNGIGGNTVSGNTISSNGVGVATNTGEEGSGLRVFGATNPTRILNNVLTNNNGSGVLVIGSANQVTISQNSTSGNTRLGIDLLADNSTPAFYNGNTGATSNVTLNDNGDTDGGGNGQLNFPVLTTANVSGTSLVVTGYARPGSLVEFFLATPLTTDPTNSNRNFGQGSSYLASRTEGNTTDDSNTGTGTYGAGNTNVNGVYQGTDNTNLFTFTIPLSGLTAAQRTALLSGNAVLTSTATLASSTSEFSGNLPLPITDVTVALTGPATVSPGQPTGTYTATFTNEGPVTAAGVTRKVTLPAGATNVVLPAGASLSGNIIDFDNGTPVSLASGASNAFSFSFTPATTATGSVAITSNITTTTSQGNNLAPDASTINATVAPVANVAAAITAVPTALAAGTPAGTGGGRFNVTFSNNGPNVANGVVASVQLPAGLTNVSSTNNSGGVYNATTGVLTYPGITSLAGGGAGNVSSTITFDVPTTNPASVGTAAGALVASARIATTTNEAGQTADNTASATLNVTPAFDLLTTISGPTQAVAGSPVTLAVTTTNNGLSATTGVVQTVQLVSGLSNVYVSNGGVYNPATSTQTLTVNGVSYSVPAGAVVFPTLVGMPSGQTVANSITFSQPASAFAPSATVTPNAAGSATTAGDTNPANNTAYLNGSASATNIATASAQPGTANAYTTITTSAATTTLGSPVTLTVTTGNNGPNQATGTTQLVQLVPGFDVTTLKVNGAAGSLSNNVITFATDLTYNVLTGLMTFPALANGANGSASGTSVTNTISLTPTAATTGRNGRLVPTASVQTTNTDPVPADNVASVGVTLAQVADLATTISGPATALPGQAVTYTASFVNNGPTVASNVTQTVQLPAGLGAVTIVDAAGNAVSGASYNSTTGLVTLPNTALDPSGATQVYKLTFVAPAQSFAPSSSIGSPTSDPSSTNNSASVATAVTPAADLATVVSGPATAVVGNAVTYAVTTTNNGPSAATNAAPTLQLPAGFDATTLRVNGTTGVLSGTTVTYTFASGATATYSTTTGLVSFPTMGSLPNGTSVSNYVTFVMPNAAGGQVAGLASASASGTTDPTSANNTASVATSIAPTTTTSADLVATVSAASGTVAAGATVTYTATYSNIGTDPAVNVVPTLQLLTGLTATTLPSVGGSAGTLSNGVLTFPNGATYSQQTGVLTFPTIASQATGAANAVSYNVQVVAPANGPLLATATSSSNTSEPNTAAAQSNNAQSASVIITPSFNEVTSVSGPATAVAGSSQTYTVTTTNNGPSATSNATTQTVTVPAGQTPTNITGGGVYSSTGNTITWTIPAGQSAGVNGAVANSFTIVQPTTATTLTAAVTVTGESNTGDNSATLTTSPTNLAPLAYTVVNSLQNPQSADAGGLANGLLISPLNASDPENSFAPQKYTIASIPTNGGANSQGTLYYNDGTANGTYSPVTAGQTLTDAQAKTLRFKAAAGFVGNASFTYTTTDAAGNTSLAANYTIPVESDIEAATYTLTPVKGGNNGAYLTGDVIAFTTDTNGAVYNAATAAVYQSNGQLQAGTTTTGGIAAATTGAFTSTDPTVTSLSGLGLTMQPDGRLVVSNPNALRAGSYTVQVTTTDANGGTTTQTVSFVIPANPLPVVLVDFTAQAVQNRDALLTWHTASEKNNDHFDIERSFDGTTFAKVGQLAGHGTTNAASAYAFTDANVAAKATGPVYYRLRQVDLDGTSAFSPVRSVSFTKAAATPVVLSLYPNPAQASTKLDLSPLPASATYQVTLLDATGRTLRTATLAGGLPQPLDVQHLASGTYHVLVTGQLADGTAFKQTMRLTKE
jgi:uncharacterized repeat protein (TIGR01451 family)